MLLLANGDSFPAFLGGATIGFFAGMMVVAYLSAKSRRARSKGPKLAGSTIPELGDGLDLSKRYDITYSGDWSSNFVEHLNDVKIVGYVGGNDDESVSKMYMRGRWLVVEFSDGRRAYLMPQSIVALRQTAVQA
jgi:hypothetical protein